MKEGKGKGREGREEEGKEGRGEGEGEGGERKREGRNPTKFRDKLTPLVTSAARVSKSNLIYKQEFYLKSDNDNTVSFYFCQQQTSTNKLRRTR